MVFGVNRPEICTLLVWTTKRVYRFVKLFSRSGDSTLRRTIFRRFVTRWILSDSGICIFFNVSGREEPAADYEHLAQIGELAIELISCASFAENAILWKKNQYRDICKIFYRHSPFGHNERAKMLLSRKPCGDENISFWHESLWWKLPGKATVEREAPKAHAESYYLRLIFRSSSPLSRFGFTIQIK